MKCLSWTSLRVKQAKWGNRASLLYSYTQISNPHLNLQLLLFPLMQKGLQVRL
jgi:hypothetical protein